MQISKRNGTVEAYEAGKIKRAMGAAFASVGTVLDDDEADRLIARIERAMASAEQGEGGSVSVEDVQDLVERALMEANHYEELKSYILYREDRARKRAARERLCAQLPSVPALPGVLASVQKEFPGEEYELAHLSAKFQSFAKPDAADGQLLAMLVKAAVELTTQEAPRWEIIAARLLMVQFDRALAERLAARHIETFAQKVAFLTEEGLYGDYILQHYTPAELDEAAGFIDLSRNDLFTYAGLQLLLDRYVIRTHQGAPLESPQEMFLGIALHLAMEERPDERMGWVRRFYDMLSTLKVTMATPTLSNARKPFHQLSSCFIDTVPDSLDGIYRSIDNFAKVSKYGGGMGLYFGKVRASGSAIRGFDGAAGGVIRWIRLANDTAVAVDQLGMRQGAVAVYLDAWHRDLPEFLALRTNNGDDRMKAHDVFPAVCYPDYFWQQARDNIEGDWYLMCPHEILTVKGYALEDCYGEEWTRKYLECVADARIKKRAIPIKDVIRLIIKSAVETGTPFTFNRDAVNRANPNKHQGMIYCSNLCTEIAQNMGAIEQLEQRIEDVDGEQVVVTVTKPGAFVVCNLASLSLGHIDMDDPHELSHVTESAVRALDNVIDLNFFPVPYAEINNRQYRPIGLGVSGYHHLLAKSGIRWESEEHLAFAEGVFGDVHYAAVRASCAIAREKGSYGFFEESGWQTGEYFRDRGLTDGRWAELARDVAEHGLRNGYLLAVAPTSSTSIIAGTTAGLDPVMNRYFLEEKKNGLMPRVAPELSMDTFWYYKNAHLIDQTWSVRACGVRQRHIDQAQSVNLYITNEYTFRRVLDLYLLAWEEGVKTIYYVRSKSLEVEECEVCSS